MDEPMQHHHHVERMIREPMAIEVLLRAPLFLQRVAARPGGLQHSATHDGIATQHDQAAHAGGREAQHTGAAAGRAQQCRMHATPRATPSASALQAAHAHNHRDPAVVDLLLQLEIVTTEKVEVQVCTSLARTRTLAHARTHAAPGRSAAPVTALALAPLPRAVRTHARTAFRATLSSRPLRLLAVQPQRHPPRPRPQLQRRAAGCSASGGRAHAALHEVPPARTRAATHGRGWRQRVNRLSQRVMG